MIVKDKEKLMALANEISSQLIEISAKEGQRFETGGDPGGHIYLLFQVVGMYCAKLCLSLEGFGKIYGIKDFTTDFICVAIDSIRNKLIDLNKKDLNFNETLQ